MAPLSAATFVFALSACGDGSVGPNDPPPGTTPVASVVVVPGSDTVLVGSVAQLTAVARSAAGDTVRNVAFSWQSLDPNVATVSAMGLVTGLSEGTARIRATTGTRFGDATITVDPVNPVPTIARLSPASVAAGGPDLTLTIIGSGFRPNLMARFNGAARPTTYVSDSIAQATLFAADLAQAGGAQIQLVNSAPGGGASAIAAFAIVPQTVPVHAVELHQEVAMSIVGLAVPMRATLRDAGGGVLTNRLLTWTSSNQLVAVVNGQGVVQPVGVGEVTITATSEGKSATLALSVGSALSHLLLDDGAALAVLDMRLGGPPTSFWGHGVGTRAVDPSVSPDGRWVAYTIDMGGRPSIGLLDLPARTYLFLTSDAGSDQPAWSPSGDQIAFRSRRAGRPDVWVMYPDGTGAVNLTATMPAGFEAGWPAWSPDGTRLVFSAGLPGSVSLYTMRADGTGVQPLLISAEHDSEPAWRGNAVVFTRRTPDGSTDLYRVTVGAGGPPLIRLTTSGAAHSPAWSPDGRWVAFADGSAVGGRYDIKAVRPFAEEIRILSGVAAGGGGRNPAWRLHQ